MNLAILGMAALMSAIFGIGPYLIVQLTATAVAGAAGVWLFYVRRQFEDHLLNGGMIGTTQALERLILSTNCPRSCSGFPASVSASPISCRIPNYNLERCHQSQPDVGGEAADAVQQSQINDGSVCLMNHRKSSSATHLKDWKTKKTGRNLGSRDSLQKFWNLPRMA
ncbi:MAG: hypothetical protein R3F31_14175 [Verrucomicrobiales bacterium]